MHRAVPRFLGALLVAGVAVPVTPSAVPHAFAAIYNPIPMNSEEEPDDQFFDSDALLVYVTSDIKGGRVCIVASTVESINEGSCDSPAWGDVNFIVGIGSQIQLIEGPTLKPGTWRLRTENTDGKGTGISETFTVDPCGSCDRTIGAATAARWKAMAKSNQVGAKLYCDVQELRAKVDAAKKIGEKKLEYTSSGITLVSVSFSPLGGFAFSVADPFKIGEAKALEILKDLTCAVSNMYGDIVKDPPDFDYDTVAPPVIPSVDPLVSDEASLLGDSLARQLALGDASLTAYERYLGAVADGNLEGIVRQAGAAASFSFDLIGELRTTARLLDAFAAYAEGQPELTGPVAATQHEIDDIASGYQRARTTGLTAGEIEQLHDTGLSDADITLFKSNFERDPSSLSPGVTLTQYATDLATTMRDSIVDLDAFAREAAAVAARSQLDLAAMNIAPTASFTATPPAGESPLAVAFDASGSSDTDGSIVSSSWNFGDGSPLGFGVTINHTYNAPGSYTATLTVTDDDGATDTTTRTTTVSPPAGNDPPLASFLADPLTGDAPLVVGFDAAASADPDGSITTYSWDFGDGSADGSGVTVTHTYNAAGPFTATLTVTDNAGATATGTALITVSAPPGNDPPVPSFNASDGGAPLKVAFDATMSSDPDGSIVSYEWDFGDGSPHGSGVSTDHTYTAAGSYPATLFVSDNEGATTSTTAVITLAVTPGNNPPIPSVVAGPLSGGLPLHVDFDATASSDADGSIVSYSWDFDDGSPPASGVTTSHTYTVAGLYTATLTITDDDGASATATGTISVAPNAPPDAADDAVEAKSSVAFDALGNDSDPEGQPLTIIGTSAPSHGTVACEATGGCLYVADAGYTGDDGFDYTIADPAPPDAAHPEDTTDTAHVSITVTARDAGSDLSARDDILIVSVGESGSVDVLANDFGPSSLAFVDGSASVPAHGSVDCTLAGLCTYVPAAAFSGYDGFSYQITDEFGRIAAALVEIRVVAAGSVKANVDGVAILASAPGTVVQGGRARWLASGLPVPSGLSGLADALMSDIRITLSGPHSLDPVSVATAPGWQATPAAGGLTLHPTADALLGESVNLALPEPAQPISQGSGGDGHVPILVGSRVFAFFHHSFPTSVTCIDRITGQLCPGYPKVLNMATDNIPGPAAVLGSEIWVHLYPLAGDAYSLFCWDAETDQPCGLHVLSRGLSGSGTPPVVVNGKIWAVDAGGVAHCFAPHGAACPVRSVDINLTAGGGTFDIVGHGTRFYVGASESASVACIDATKGASCAGWDQPRVLSFASNIVNRFSAAGVTDGVCAVGTAGSECVPDGGGPTTTHDAWPLADGYHNITQEAEAGTRTLYGSLGRGGMGCWDWTTMAGCTGGGFVDGWLDHDVDGIALPSAYGVTFDGSCAVGLGDPGLVFTVRPAGASPCTSIATGSQSRVVNLRDQRCDSKVGAARWRDVRVIGANLGQGAEFSSLVVIVRDALTGQILASRETVGTGGTVDLLSIDAAAHPALVLEATATSVAGNPSWADNVSPQLELRWFSDPAAGCFRTRTTVNCATPSPTTLAVEATTGATTDVSNLQLIQPLSCLPPTAQSQSVSTPEDTPRPITLAGTDPNGDPLTFTIGSPPTHGAITGTGANRIYEPNPDYSGPDSFTFTVSDDARSSTAKTVSITVTPVNDVPVALPDSATTAEDTPVAIAALINDTDLDGDVLTVTELTQPPHGRSRIRPDGAIEYAPAVNYGGPDSFTYTISDGHVGTAIATVTVSVVADPHPDEPVLVGSMTPVASGALAGATAVLVNLGMVNGAAPGYITANKCSALVPGPQTKSNGNHGISTAIANLSVVPVDADGRFCIYNQSPVDMIADVQGSFAPPGPGGLVFIRVAPTRKLDTRIAPLSRPPAGSITRVETGAAAGKVAVLVNLAMDGGEGPGYITADKCSALVAGPQSKSSGNHVKDLAISNLSVVPVDPDGAFCIYNQVAVNIIVDLQGSFSTDFADGLLFAPLTPTRKLDTREPPLLRPADGSITRVVTGVPAGTKAVLVNLAMDGGAGPGYITADKCSALVAGPQSKSNGNHVKDLAISNLAVVPVDADGSFCIYNQTSVHLVVDLQGSFSEAGTHQYFPIDPFRAIDTR